jgi:hypothetical protein
MATSDGKGKKLDSIIIIIKIPVYHNSDAKFTIVLIISFICYYLLLSYIYNIIKKNKKSSDFLFF